MSRESWSLLAVGVLAGLVALFSWSGLSSSVLTAALTTLLGVVVFVLGQWILKIYIEPIQEQRTIIGRVEHALRYYDYQPYLLATRSSGGWPGEEVPTASENMPPGFVVHAKGELNQLAAELVSNKNLIPRYEALARWGLVKRREEVEDAAMGLIEMSATFGDPEQEYRDTRGNMIRVQSALGITIGRTSGS